MNQFVLQHGSCNELRLFPHIPELGIKKNVAIQLNYFPATATGGIRIYYIMEGKFAWAIDHQSFTLYPGDAALEWQSYFHTQPLFEEIINYEGEWMKNSFITLSEKPGIGVDINEEGKKKMLSPGFLFLNSQKH
jgi:hypothetical protein